MRFRLLVSRHAQKEPLLNDDGKPVLDDKGVPVKVQKVYHRGDIVENNEVDLAARFNSPGSVKFERLPDDRKRPAAEGPAKVEQKPAQPQQLQAGQKK